LFGGLRFNVWCVGATVSGMKAEEVAGGSCRVSQRCLRNRSRRLERKTVCVLSAEDKSKKCEDTVVSEFPGTRVAVQTGPLRQPLARRAYWCASLYFAPMTVGPAMKSTIGGFYLKNKGAVLSGAWLATLSMTAAVRFQMSNLNQRLSSLSRRIPRY
jgi:hypothetical protein